jgi:hypothetical protein
MWRTGEGTVKETVKRVLREGLEWVSDDWETMVR